MSRRLWTPSPDELALALQVIEARGDLPSDGSFQRFKAILSAQQIGVIDDTHALVALDCGRRAGKTTTFIGAGLREFDRHARAAVCYFAPSDEQGTDIVWEDIRDYNRRYELGLEEHWTERWWTRGGRKIEVLGFNSRKDVERARGRKFHLVWIDEAQLGPDWFAAFVEQAIMPTTLDYSGQIVVSGTPAPVADGFFFEACHDTSGKWSNAHHWTCADNPFFAGRDPLREARERYHLAEDSITYRREWLGLWIVDPDALVYAIPDAAVRPAGGEWFANIIGLDFGFKDRDALSVVGIEKLRQWSHLRHIVEMDGKQTNHALFGRILALAEKFPGPNGKPIVVFDPAGHTTNKTIETFRVDAPGISWVPADKRRKVEYIDLLNDALRAGGTFVEPGSPMLKEAKRLRWKRPGKVAEDADHSDLGDAWLYAWRYARDLLRALPERRPKRGELDPYEEMMAARAEADAKAGRAGYFADRLRQIG